MARVDAIAEFVSKTLTVDQPESVADTLHAFLILFAMNAKLIGLDKKQVVWWLLNQWDGIDLSGEEPSVGNLINMPCSKMVH